MAIKIQKDRVVSLTYRLLDGDGRVLEEKSPEDPYEYLHGRGQIVGPVERALEGKTPGFRAEVNVSPREGYGEYDAALVAEIPVSRFPPQVEVTVGMKFNTQDASGRALAVRVIEVEDGIATVDGNHPLAGLDLVFDLRVLDVREALPEEVEAGQPRAAPMPPSSGSGFGSVH